MYLCAHHTSMEGTNHLQLVIEVQLHKFLPQVKCNVTDVLIQFCLHLEEKEDSSHCVQPADVGLFPHWRVKQDLLH